MKRGFLEITTSGETVEKVKMAILPIYESLKIKNLQTAKDHKMAISRVFRQSRKNSLADFRKNPDVENLFPWEKVPKKSQEHQGT